MHRSRRVLWLTALLTLFGPSHAEAYCVSNKPMAIFWSGDFPDLHIPVWVSLSAKHTVELTGQTPQDVARLAIEVIARHNEAVRAPKLYFAGFTTDEFDRSDTLPWRYLPAGITIMGVPDCLELELLCNKDRAACADAVTRGPATMNQWIDDDPVGWVFLGPEGCKATGYYSLTGAIDMAQLLLHEFGHTLGLQHSNRNKPTCEFGGHIHAGPIDGTVGVMNSAMPASFAAYRTWRRDDLAALDHLYGAAANEFEIAWWDDANYPDYPDEAAANSLIDMPVSRTAVVSNRAPSGVQALVTTAPDGRVIHRLMNEVGEVSPDLVDIAVDPTPSGLTWALPAMAMGGSALDERVFVAWIANESQDSVQLTLRTAVRPTSELTWQYFDHPDPFLVNRLSAGYDPETDAFVVTTLDPYSTHVRVLFFDLDGAPLGPPVVFENLYAFSVGGPLCDASRCLIPFSESAFGGPDFGIAEVTISPQTAGATLLSLEILKSASTFGNVALIGDGHELLGVTGERRFIVGDYPGLTLDGTELFFNANNDWALGVGVWGDANASSRRLFQPRPVECGNGVVQAREECDDANTILGDGCEACLIVEIVDPDPDPSTDSGTDAGETGGGPGSHGENGCECRAGDSGGSGWLGFMSVLGILALVARPRREWPCRA